MLQISNMLCLIKRKMFMVLGIEVDIFTKFYIQCPAWLGRQCTVRLSRNMPALPDR